MVKAHGYGIKLLISIHSYNALEGNKDFYGKWYGTGDFCCGASRSYRP
jgi:mannan endo-1,4-beta-mannosidase